jgi:hypothetical protein
MYNTSCILPSYTTMALTNDTLERTDFNLKVIKPFHAVNRIFTFALVNANIKVE